MDIAEIRTQKTKFLNEYIDQVLAVGAHIAVGMGGSEEAGYTIEAHVQPVEGREISERVKKTVSELLPAQYGGIPVTVRYSPRVIPIP